MLWYAVMGCRKHSNYGRRKLEGKRKKRRTEKEKGKDKERM